MCTVSDTNVNHFDLHSKFFINFFGLQMDLIGIKSKLVKDRIEELLNIEESGYNSKADIARALDVKPQYLNSILNGGRNVSDKFFRKFTEIFNISQNDLDRLRSEEEKYVKDLHSPRNMPCQSCVEKERTIQILSERIEELKETISMLREERSGKRHSA